MNDINTYRLRRFKRKPRRLSQYSTSQRAYRRLTFGTDHNTSLKAH
jgi:hypothetical protein